MLSKESSNVINLLKCMMCISVVYIHSQIYKSGGVIYCNTEIYDRFQHCIADTFLDHTCVPLFFCMSGFLFFLKKPYDDMTAYFKKKIISRVKSLIVPYIIANILTLLFLYVMSLYTGKDPLDGYGNVLNAMIGINEKHSNPIDMPLWFIRNLMAIALITPLIYACLRYVKLVFFTILTISWFTLEIRIANSWVDCQILYFSIGACLAMYDIDIVQCIKPQRYGLVYSILYVLLLWISETTGNSSILKITILASFPMWISLAYYVIKITQVKVSSFFVTVAFFVFLYHFYLPSYLYALYFHFIPHTNCSMFIAFALIPGLITLLLTSFYYWLNKYFARLSYYIVGGR